jgi:hypothetical protein
MLDIKKDLPAMKALFEDGKSMAEIGRQYSVSREWVRRLFNKFKVDLNKGGLVKRRLDIAKNKKETDEQECLRMYGCSCEEANRIPSEIRLAWYNQKRNYEKRNIDFSVSLKDWYGIWRKSKKLKLRGKGSGKYVMARKDFSKPATADNLHVVSHNQSSILGHKH